MISDSLERRTDFAALSYGVVVCGYIVLMSTGELGIGMSALFFFSVIVAWFLEGSKLQLSDRFGTFVLVASVPAFYLAWRFQLIGLSGNESQIAALLARLIALLSIVKLLQRKADRDWLFLYLMSFFEVMLAAGMSISPLYFVSVVIYLLVTITAIVAFEIQKSFRTVHEDFGESRNQFQFSFLRRLPFTAVGLLTVVILFAAPIFFVLPRTGGAGFGGGSNGLSGFTGFSDTVEIGSIGRLKQNNEVVMRVKLDDATSSGIEPIKWRGVSLDRFDGRKWSRTNDLKEPFVKIAGDFMRFDRPAAAEADIAIQTIYLEPINSDVLFGMPRAFAIRQSRFPILYKDAAGNLSFPRSENERVVYTMFSDRKIPPIDRLIADSGQLPVDIGSRYLQLPTVDSRIPELTSQITAGSFSAFDKAKAIETYLQSQFGYTLEMKAGGADPLADFLFNIREGHCEYFATAMTVMLRTQGIPARLVNGFQRGEYNETADAFIVRQSDAHSWVEVYFPDSETWVSFDPTPFAGQFNETNTTGFLNRVGSYLEAVETLWVTYFVAYDDQGQRSLFRAVKTGFSEFQSETSSWLKIAETEIVSWWKDVRGDKGLQNSLTAIAYGIGVVVIGALFITLAVFIYRRIKRIDFARRLAFWSNRSKEKTIIEFYRKMERALSSKGFTRESHQTPLEFAFALKMPEAVKITEKYNRVRFGEKNLSNDEAKEIENWLKNLESKENGGENDKS